MSRHQNFKRHSSGSNKLAPYIDYNNFTAACNRFFDARGMDRHHGEQLTRERRTIQAAKARGQQAREMSV